MSSLDNIINIERSIHIYRSSDNESVEEIIIDVPLDKLKEIVTPKEDDPQLYEGYILTAEQLDKINALIDPPITPDFSQFFYVLEATAVYDWSAN